MKINQSSSCNVPGAKPMELQWKYGTYTVWNISHQLQYLDEKPDPEIIAKQKQDGWRTIPAVETRTAWRAEFCPDIMSHDPAISDVYNGIMGQADRAIDRFLEGNLSEEELASQFESMLTTFGEKCEERGYPHPLFCEGKGVIQCRTESFYDEFRRRILQAAVDKNNAEGRKYLTGNAGPGSDWRYYNADYYYKSEAALSAITDGLMSYTTDRWGYEDFTLRDYAAEKMNLYNNFNSAWCNKFDLDQQYIIDENQAPPEGFKWFYQCGSTEGGNRLLSMKEYDPRTGRTRILMMNEPDPNVFDPTWPYSATMWASFRDEDGKEHRVSKIFAFDRNEPDLRGVSDLLHFAGKGKAAQAASRFLENLQVYTVGYFGSRYTKRSGKNILDIRA